MDRLDAKAIKTYKEIILILDQCIDDYLFVMDLDKDIYFISPHAMKRFKTVFLFGSIVEVNRLRIMMGMLNILLAVLMKLVKDKLLIMIVGY